MEQKIERNLTLESKYTITSADADMNARLRVGALVNFLIQSAISSAHGLGFGFKDLKKHHLFWVLSRLTIEIEKPLIWDQSVTVETWPKDVAGLIYLRDFLIYRASGNCVAKATSGWLAIDSETKRPKIVEGTTAELFTLMRHKHAIETQPLKLAGVPEGDISNINPGYSDLDLNKHVTSTRYIDWMIDTLPLDLLQNKYPKSISVNYMRETMLGDNIQLVKKQEGNLFHFEGINTTKNTVAFRGAIGF
jgi:acyl-ACP thioesterase